MMTFLGRRIAQMAPVFLALELLSTPAAAQVRVIYESGGDGLFSIEAPDHWIVATGTSIADDLGESTIDGAEPDPPRVIGLHPEGDHSVWIGLLSPPEIGTIAEAEAYVKAMGANLVQGAEVTRTEDGNLGDIPAQIYSGKGTREDAPVDFIVAIAPLPNGRVAVGIFIGEYGGRQIYDPEITAIAESFRAEGARQ